jgi:hypothetical protein
VVLDDQDLPFFAIKVRAAVQPFATALNTDDRLGLAKRVCPAVGGIGQDMPQGVIDWQLPDDMPALRAVAGRR